MSTARIAWPSACRVGTRGEWYGEVTGPDGNRLWATYRIGGKGAKARALELCREWMRRNGWGEAAPLATARKLKEKATA